MKDSIYVLCFKGKLKNGKEEICPIYKDKLRLIDQFTAYGYGIYKCLDEERLFEKLPNDLKLFLEKCFIIDKNNLKDSFFVRKDVKNIRMGRTDFPVLFYDDADVVYAKENEILKGILFFNIPLEDFKNKDEIIEIKKSFFKDLYNLLSLNVDSDLTDVIDNIIRIENDFSINRIKGITCIREISRNIANYVCKDYLLKRKVSLLIKEYKKEIRKITSCDIDFFNSLDLYSKIQNRDFNYKYAISEKSSGSFNQMLHLNKGFFEKKYRFTFNDNEEDEFDIEKEIESCKKKIKKLNTTFENAADKTHKKIIAMLIENLKLKITSLENNENYSIYEFEVLKLDRLKAFYELLNGRLVLAKDDTYIKIIKMLIDQIKLKIEFKEKIDDGFDNYETNYDKCEEKISELDNLRIMFENLRNESVKSKMVSEGLIHFKMDKLDLEKSLEESLKNGNGDMIDYYRKKIADIEEKITGLESGDFYYSDAGILVRKEDMDDGMRM